jgi:hypothetical protein
MAVLPPDIGLEASSDAFWKAQRLSNYKQKKKSNRRLPHVPFFAEDSRSGAVSSSRSHKEEPHLKLTRKTGMMMVPDIQQRFSLETFWSRETRKLLVDFMSNVKVVQSSHIEFVLQYLFELLRKRRLCEVLLVLRCVRSCSHHIAECASWRLPFYVLLATAQEAIRQGHAGSVAPLCTASFVPTLSQAEQREALALYKP